MVIPDEPQVVPPSNAEDLAGKAGFPEVEKDMSPSAALPGAIKAVQRQIKKLDGLLSKFPEKQKERKVQEGAEDGDRPASSNCLQNKFRGSLWGCRRASG